MPRGGRGRARQQQQGREGSSAEPLLDPSNDGSGGDSHADYLGVPISPVIEESPASALSPAMPFAAGGPTVPSAAAAAHGGAVSPMTGLTVKVPGPSLATAPDPDETPSVPGLYTPVLTPMKQPIGGAGAFGDGVVAQPAAQPGLHSMGNTAPRFSALNHAAHCVPPPHVSNGIGTHQRGAQPQPRSAPRSSPNPPPSHATVNGISSCSGSRRNSGCDAYGSTTFFHACTDYRPLLSKRSEYFAPDVAPVAPLPPLHSVGSVSSSGAGPSMGRARADSLAPPAVVRDTISVVVPCFTESGRSLQKTLYDLWIQQDFMHKNKTYFAFHVCIILDGWSKAPPSLQAYIRQLFQSDEEHEDVKYGALQREVEQEQERARYPNEHAGAATTTSTASHAGDGGKQAPSADISSSDISSDSDDSDEEAPSSSSSGRGGLAVAAPASAGGGRDVKFQQPLLRARPSSAFAALGSTSTAKSSSGSGGNTNANVKSPSDATSFLFPESISFSGQMGLAHPDPEVQSQTRSWERYISNWSADSELNPPTNPETIIVQKHCLGPDGVARGIKPIPLFPELADWEPAVALSPSAASFKREREKGLPKEEDEETLRRKKGAHLKMTMIIKRDNRRKHNSHEWFLNAFAPVYTTRLPATSTSATGVQLVFMTDAGTRFHESCVLSLVQHALQTPTTVACSGRQRVMTHRMQQEGEPPTDKWSLNFLRGQLYRCAQGISAFNGAFHSTGMLPVLPGPCGLFRLDIILREGDEAEQERAKQKEKVRAQVGRLRAIHQASSKALFELHSYVWSSLTVTKQMHRATWAAYQKRQMSQSLVRGGGGGGNSSNNVLEPFTPWEKAEAAFEYVELKTQLFSLTNELQRNQLLLLTVLLRLDPASVCVRDIDKMLSSESLVWARMQNLLVLIAQLHALEASPALATPPNWDAQIQAQLQQLRKLMAAQIVVLQEYLQRIALADGGLLASVKTELSLDQEEQDHLVDQRARAELAAARDPVEFYFSIVNQLPNEVDLITANLMLAEDRVLSYCVVLMADQPVHTSFVPDALFYFEAETEAENALQQSRRWTNGTVAGFLWLFFSGIKFRQARYGVYVLVAAQLMMYAIVGVSPALWTIGLRYSLGFWFGPEPRNYCDWITLLYLGMYALFVLLHSDPTPGKKRLHVWLFHCLTVVNMGVATLPLVALAPQFVHGCRDETQPQGRGWAVLAGMSLQCWILGAAVVGTVVLPFVLAILYDIYRLLPACNKRPVSRRLRNCPYGLSFVGGGWGSVTWEMVSSAAWFYLFLPTKVSIYPAYAFSRTFELSWGNKPSEELLSVVSTKNPRQLEATRKSMLQLSQVISYSLLLANILLFLIVSVVGVKSGALVVLTTFILLWALLQMGMSLVWILYRLFVAPLFKLARIVAEWLDVFKQNQNRPVPLAPHQLQQQQQQQQQQQCNGRPTAAGGAQRQHAQSKHAAPAPPHKHSQSNHRSHPPRRPSVSRVAAAVSNAAAPRIHPAQSAHTVPSATSQSPLTTAAAATANPKAPLVNKHVVADHSDYQALA